MEPQHASFLHPEPQGPGPRIMPVFLPYAGCPGRCLYCAQEEQTGTKPRPLEQAHQELSQTLEGLGKDRTMELAYYGATFTALSPDWQERFLNLGQRFRDKGLISRVRCSTRPDALDPARLKRLKGLGLDMVELGVQSFDDQALAESGRGYNGQLARSACAMVQDAGMALGVQLMPGMPGLTPEAFLADAEQTRDLRPETARLYPCLVIQGSPLADQWRAGQYRPMDLATAADLLARALLVLWPAGVRVIRMGLAPEQELLGKVLAGPWHPALGLLARSRALLALVRERVRGLGGKAAALEVPKRLQGEFWGHKAELKPDYAALGLTPESVRFEAREDLLLTIA